jgi:hypothetical protein
LRGQLDPIDEMIDILRNLTFALFDPITELGALQSKVTALDHDTVVIVQSSARRLSVAGLRRAKRKRF